MVARALDANVVTLGSAGAKAMAVVNGIADVYVHAGGMYQWDSAAPAAVALAAGLHVSRIDGSPIVYNEPDPWLPDFLVCRPAFAEPVLAAHRRRPPEPAAWPGSVRRRAAGDRPVLRRLRRAGWPPTCPKRCA